MKKNSLISVIITCYNYGDFVEEAIGSVLTQTYKNIELIIINDGSTDSSDSIIREHVKVLPSIKYIHQENRGIVYTRNLGLTLSNGEYILFLDADDKLPVDYVENCVSFAEKNQVDIVTTDFMYIGSGRGRNILPEYSLELMKNMNVIHISSLIRKSIIGENRFDEKLSRRSHEDWDFFLGLVLKGVKVAKNNKTFLYYRQHKKSRNNAEKSDTEKFEYAEVYRDVIHKYSLLYSKEMYYLSGTRFANQLSVVYRKLIPNYEKEIAKREVEIQKLKTQELKIINSKTYKIGQLVVYLPKQIKRILK